MEELGKDEISELIKSRVVYNFFDFCLINELYKSGIIEKTPVNYNGVRKLSKHSLMFSYDFLVKDYIKNNNLYEKYKEAMSGSGQNGYNKFAPIHSSSLFPFLIFSLVNKKNILKIPGLSSIEFYDVVFEYKNIVFSMPSNIDVLLIGSNNDKKVLLFLECKFSEYLKTTKASSYTKQKNEKKRYFSEKYKDSFDRYLHPFKGKVKYNDFSNNNEGFQLVSVDPIYIDGIKQMIHHYIGITNFTNKNFYRCNHNKKIEEDYASNNDTEIFFGEIVFDFNSEFSNKKMKNYKDTYSLLKSSLNDNDKITLLDDLLLYQDLFLHNENSYFEKLYDVFKQLYQIKL